MASSQVHIVSSCVLRDHNRRERYVGSNAHVAMQKNLKDLVQSCISAPPRIPNSNLNDNSNSCNASSLAQTQQSKTNNRNHTNSRDSDRWAKAREIVFRTELSPAQSECSAETRAVSSLVKRWRDFEAESKNLNLNNGNNNNNNNNNNNAINSSVCSSRSNSNSTFTETASILEVPRGNSLAASESVEERFDNPSLAEDSFLDWESDRTLPSGRTSTYSRDSNTTEKERIRVADIIRKLTSVNGEEYNDREQFVEPSLPKVGTSLDLLPQEMRGGLGAVMASPRIRGRQAFNDLLMQMERDRHKELQGLGERKAVSKFSQRGRIQALLKVRFLRHELEVKNGDQINSAVSERSKNSQGSSVMHLRARFNTRVEHSAADSSPRKEVINNTTQDGERSSASIQLKELIDHIPTAENSSTSKQVEEEVQPREVINVADDTPGMETCSTSSRLQVDISRTPNEEISFISNELKEEIHPQQVTDPISPRIIVNDTPDVGTCSTSNRIKVDIKHDDVIMTPQPNTSQLKNTEDPQKEANPNVGAFWQLTSLEVKNFDSQESQNRWKGKNVAEEMANKQQSIASLYDWINDISPSHHDWEDQVANKRHLEEPSPDWTSNLPQAPSEWEEDQSSYQQLEDQSSYQQLEETYYDWISDIARPRSDWEGLRQERYQEMLDPFTDNRDIKQLLERRSVSSFLSSVLRDRIDQLMISRTQGQQNLIENRVEEHMEEGMVVREEENEEREENEQEEASAEQYEEIEEEDKSPIARQFCEVGEYFDQTPSSSLNSASPSLLRSWSPNRNDDVSDDSLPSPSLQKFLSFKSYTQDTQQSSSFRNQQPSIEMELIHDLRGHMEQLHQEISELRKSLKGCMNMQVKVQRYMKHEAAGSASHSARRKGESINRIPRKGTCCLCYDSEVDSLLYRCGHICTCFKCAQELQWGSGKCPICRAPILDVVRTYTD